MPKFTTIPFGDKWNSAVSAAESHLAPVLKRASRKAYDGIVYEVDDTENVSEDENGRVYVELQVIGTYNPEEPGAAYRAFVCVELTENFEPIRHDFDAALEAAIEKADADAEIYRYESYRYER